MLSFFTILLILLGANAVFMIFSLSGSGKGNKKSRENPDGPSVSKTYPFQTLSSKFKKAG